MPLGRKLRYGMVGGGPEAFIGAVHRNAIALDASAELVAGAFSANADKSRQQGEELLLDPSRVYGSYQEMAEKEEALPADERIDFVAIVTPNHVHFPVAKAFIEALRENDGVIDGTRLFSKIRRPVILAAQQTPEYSDVRQAGHDGGDLLFVRQR